MARRKYDALWRTLARRSPGQWTQTAAEISAPKTWENASLRLESYLMSRIIDEDVILKRRDTAYIEALAAHHKVV
jgi:hypothetical protein